jgi:hypothetical protein
MGPLLGAVNVLLLTQAMQGAIAGRILEAETAQPVAGAAVTVTDVGRTTAADDSGRYVLQGLPAGPHEITVHFVGYASESLQALVPDEGRLEIDFRLRPDPVRMKSVDVHAPIFVRGLDGGSASFPDREISATAMRNDPLLAEPDALLALGGGEIALREETPSGVSIRGGASDQTAYLLDGIPIFTPYHAAGLSSGWNPDALSNLRVGSATPIEPNALGGTIEGTTRPPGDRIRSRGSVSTSQWRLTFDGPLRLGAPTSPQAAPGMEAEPANAAGAGYLVSLRSGLPDVFAPGDETSYIRGDIGDWLTKFETPALGGRIQLLGYGNENDLNTAVSVAPDEGGTGDVRRNTFEWNSQSLGARWTRTFSRTALRVVGWRADGDVGSTWEALTGPLVMSANRRDEGVLIGVDHRSDAAGTSAQLRYERDQTRYRIASDSASGPAWAMRASLPVMTALARRSQPIGRALQADLGASVSPVRNRWWVAPNARLLWRLSSSLTLSGSYARSHQFAQSLRNPESVVGNVFPADINIGVGGAVPVARSDLGVLAASIRPRAGIEFGAQAYARRSNGLLLIAPGEPEPFATSAPTVGSGTSYGLSADAALRAKRAAFVLSYGFHRARLEYAYGSYVPENAARHTVEGGFIVFPSASTSVRVGVTATLGRLATAIANGFEWESTNLLDQGTEFGGSPHYSGDGIGGAALPAYYRLDLGARKEWRLGMRGREGTLALFVTGTNLLARRNYLTYARNPSTGEIFGVEMRPLAPLVVGLDWAF